MSKFYGPGFGGMGLANTAIKYQGSQVSMFFRAERDGFIAGFRSYMIGRDGGYGDGDGGILRWRIEEASADDLTVPGGVPRGGTALVDRPLDEQRDTGDRRVPWYRRDFDEPVPVWAGKVYHLIVTNEHPDYKHNYVSVNALYRCSGPATEDTGLTLRHDGNPEGEWHRRLSPEGSLPYVPNLVLYYDDGHVQGKGYIHAMQHNDDRIEADIPEGETFYDIRETVSRNEMVRQVIEPHEDVWVSDFHVLLRRRAGDGRVWARYENENGEWEEVCHSIHKPLPENAHPTSRDFPLDTYAWYTLPFSPRVLKKNVFTTVTLYAKDPGTEFEAGVLRHGKGYWMEEETTFDEGWAEKNEDDGTGWRYFDVWGSPYRPVDLMFYFDLSRDGRMEVRV